MIKKNDIIIFAEEKQLKPVAWYNIKYPSYALKATYRYPSSDPSDYQDRALLSLIRLGIPYSEACDLLLIDDPHQSILRRFLGNTGKNPLVYHNPKSGYYELTPLGNQRVDNPILTNSGVKTCYIDGQTGEPFPKDVVDRLKESKLNTEDINSGLQNSYPFNPNIENQLESLSTKIKDRDSRSRLHRLTLPQKASEVHFTGIGPEWMMNFTIGIFSKDGQIKRFLFVGDSTCEVSPFGYVRDLSQFKLSNHRLRGNNMLGYTKARITDGDSVIDKDSLTNISKIIVGEINNIYGKEAFSEDDISIDAEKGIVSLKIIADSLYKIHNKSILTNIRAGYFLLILHDIEGGLCISIRAEKKVIELANLYWELNNSSNWEESVEIVKKKYPSKREWRSVLLQIGRDDLLFRNDVKHFIGDDVKQYIEYKYE